MTKKISFEVSNIDILQDLDTSSFAILSIDAFASGDNAHHLPVSVETLKKTAGTIKMKPVVWKYDMRTDDAKGHEKDETICGFVPESSEITFRKMDDGRVILNVTAAVWKKYSGNLPRILQRDKSKAVSVELSVLDSQVLESGEEELLDFTYDAITILGTFVRPAIPGAGLNVIKFSELYQQDQQFSGKYNDIDFKIPATVKKNAKHGLELYDLHMRGGTSVSLATARFLVNNDTITVEKAQSISKHLAREAGKHNPDDQASDEFIMWQLLGGSEAYVWSSNLCQSITEADKKYENMTHFNSDEQDHGNQEVNSNMEIEKTNDAQEFEDKPVEKPEEEMAAASEQPMADEKPADEKPEEMAAESAPMAEDKPADDEAGETPDDEAKEDKEDGDENDTSMSLDSYADVGAMLEFLKAETESYKAAADENDEEAQKTYAMLMACCTEAEKPKSEADMSVLLGGLVTYCKLMSSQKAKLSSELDARMTENMELAKFQKEIKDREFQFEVESVLGEASNTGMPRERVDELRLKASEFSTETFDAYKNLVRAEAFTYTKKDGDIDVIYKHRIPRPFNDVPKSDSIWH